MAKVQGSHPLKHPFEILAVCIVIFGYFLAIAANNALASYITLLVSGALFGRLASLSKRKRLPAALLLAAFLAGYLMGLSAGHPILILASLLAGAWYGYNAQDKGLWPLG